MDMETKLHGAAERLSYKSGSMEQDTIGLSQEQLVVVIMGRGKEVQIYDGVLRGPNVRLGGDHR
jgi:hypothetical protein